MGTSQSYGGPTGSAPSLLPPWADPFPRPDDESVPPDGEIPQPLDPEGEPVDPASTGEGSPDQVDDSPGVPDIEQPASAWRAPKANMTRFVNTGERGSLSRAASGYVAAKGGSRGAARAATSGKSTTARLGGVLSSIANVGIQQTLQSLGLSHLVGKPATEVLAAVCENIAPPGASLEEAAARAAATEALAELYDQYDLDSSGIDGLDALDAEGVEKAIELSVQAYIYERWLQELGKRIESNTASPDEAVRLETEVKDYIRAEVSYQLEDVDVLEVDWESAEMQALVEEIFATAYSCLEEEE